VRWLIATLLILAGCDRLVGLRDLHPRADASTSDGRRDATPDSLVTDGRQVDGGTTISCSIDDLRCTNNPRSFLVNDVCYAECPDLVSWAAAQQRCMAWGGDLAVLDTPAEDTAVTTAMTNGGHWIGMVQMQTATAPAAGWVWITGTSVNNARWYSGEPMDGADQTENHQEDCAYATAVGWGDFSCTVAALTLCER
jgi:hypothetical protein